MLICNLPFLRALLHPWRVSVTSWHSFKTTSSHRTLTFNYRAFPKQIASHHTAHPVCVAFSRCLQGPLSLSPTCWTMQSIKNSYAFQLESRHSVWVSPSCAHAGISNACRTGSPPQLKRTEDSGFPHRAVAAAQRHFCQLGVASNFASWPRQLYFIQQAQDPRRRRKVSRPFSENSSVMRAWWASITASFFPCLLVLLQYLLPPPLISEICSDCRGTQTSLISITYDSSSKTAFIQMFFPLKYSQLHITTVEVIMKLFLECPQEVDALHSSMFIKQSQKFGKQF